MKKLALFSLIGLIAMTAQAQDPANDTMVTISGAKSGAAQQGQAMSADQYNQFAGSYELSNGGSLALFSRGLKKYAALHGEAWHEVVATSANSFVAKDSALKFDIYREDNGVVHGEVYIPQNEMQTAQGANGRQFVKLAFR